MTSEVTEVMVESVHVHADSAQHVVLLRERDGERYLPIWIGPWEASAIASRLQGMLPERPLTHDLYTRTLVELGARVRRVTVSDLTDDTYRARILLDLDGTEYDIDARPSDAIALALRTSSPIFVEEAVIQSARSVESGKESMDVGRLQKWLEGLSEDELGKYKM